jgi:hypothetical protein
VEVGQRWSWVGVVTVDVAGESGGRDSHWVREQGVVVNGVLLPTKSFELPSWMLHQAVQLSGLVIVKAATHCRVQVSILVGDIV